MTKLKKVKKVRSACEQAFKDMQLVFPKPMCNRSAQLKTEHILRDYQNLLTT